MGVEGGITPHPHATVTCGAEPCEARALMGSCSLVRATAR